MTKDHTKKAYTPQGERPERNTHTSKSYAFIFSDDLKDWGVSRAQESRQKRTERERNTPTKGRAANL